MSMIDFTFNCLTEKHNLKKFRQKKRDDLLSPASSWKTHSPKCSIRSLSDQCCLT